MSGRDCCFVIRASRGKDVVAEFLGDVRPAFWVSDRFGSQLGWASSDHRVCLAHLHDAKDCECKPSIGAAMRSAVWFGTSRAAVRQALRCSGRLAATPR
jgi:hypothetical protein